MIRCRRCADLQEPASLRELQGSAPVSHTVVGELLTAQKFSLQAIANPRGGGILPNAQFAHINTASRQRCRRQPVISVDTKKKEIVGDFKNAGRTCGHRATRRGAVYDFLSQALGRAIPYGVYDLGKHGWVSVGVDMTRPPSLSTIRLVAEHRPPRYPKRAACDHADGQQRDGAA